MDDISAASIAVYRTAPETDTIEHEDQDRGQ